MTADQFDLADKATTLRDAYRELTLAKGRRVVREARVMRPKPGPQAPTPTHLLSLEAELTHRLQEMTSECMVELGATTQAWPEPTSLCTWVRYHAGPISQLAVADALLDEMTDQAQQIRHTLDSMPGAEAKISRRHAITTALNSDRWGTAEELAPLVASITGTTIDRTRITSIGRNPKFDTRVNYRGHKQYSLAQLINHFTPTH